MLALTGTADKGTTDAIISSLGLKKDRLELFVSPNITNIRISVVKIKKDAAFTQLHWISDIIREQRLDCPKTLVFCNTMKDIAEVGNYLLFKLGRNAYFPTGSFQMADCIIGIYHSMTWQENKERIIKSMKGEGKKRVFIASSALSMGVHFPDVQYVFDWGPARNLLDHRQQSGRAGRDGLSSDVVVIYHGHQLSHCEDDVKTFVHSGGCLRVASYGPFDPDVQSLKPPPSCCSNCCKICVCGENGCVLPNLPFLVEAESSETQVLKRSRMLTYFDKEELSEGLIELKDRIEGHGALFECTGFLAELIEQSQFIFTLQDLMETSPVFFTSTCHCCSQTFCRNVSRYMWTEWDLVALLAQENFFEEPSPPCFVGNFVLSDSDLCDDELGDLDILT